MKGKKKPKDRKQHLGGRSRTVTFINRTLTAAAAADAEADAGKGAGVPGESERYSDVRLIGEGGMGRVYLAHDNALGRQVALKMLREEISNPSDSSRFIEEARITSGLEHPNIIPTYGIGVDEEQRIYYTMKYVPQRDLRSLIEETAREEGDQPLRRSSLFRFLQILRGVCQAVQFAHDQGILHRDLKPENIMVGSYGEALVVDWGLAVRYRKPDSRDGEGNAGAARPARAIIGTPRYMSPEQAEGNVAGLDPRSDLYSLGAILQECLTLGPMVEGDRVDEVLERVRRGGLPSPREQAPHRDIPEALDEICRRATARSRDDRIAGAGDLLEEIDLFLEGTRERERNEREASKRVEEARRESNGWRELAREVETLEEDLRSRSEGIDEWESEEHKLPLWRAQDRLKELRFESAQAFGRAVTRLDEALGYLPDHAEARAALAELYYDRFTEAERSLREEEAIFFGSKAHQYDDGRLAERLEGTGRISLTTEPAAEEILLCTLRDELLRRVPGEPVALGAAPLVEHPLPMGSHLIILRRKGYRDIRLPILMSRCERLAVRVPFYTDEEIGRGYVHVPGGRFIVGGDALAHEAHDLMTVELPAFAVAREPVTAREYLEFLNHLDASDEEEAARRVPRTRPEAGAYWKRLPEGGYWMPDDEEGVIFEPEWPVFGVSWHDAVAYCEWRSGVEAWTCRLPGDLEWEKMARGVDGRVFPWGNGFDATFCKMDTSRAGKPQPEPVGTFSGDESIYGVRDVAGCIREWCSDWKIEPKTRVVRGGSWSNPQMSCRCAYRASCEPYLVYQFIGFRVAHDLPRR